MNSASLIKLMLIPTLVFTVTVSQAAPQTLWKEGIDYIAISDQESGIKADHPYQLNTQKLARILSQIEVTEKEAKGLSSIISTSSGNKERRVFTDKEIDILAQGITNALNKASISETVTFSVSDFRSVYFGDKRLSISGTAFIQNNAFNLLLGEVHVDLQKKYIRSGEGVSNSRFASNVELSHFKLPTGNVKKETNRDWALKTFPGATVVDDRSDWLRVSLDQQYNYQQLKEESETIQQKYLSETQKSQNSDKESEIEARLLRLEQATQNTAIEQTQSNEGSIEARLKKVKALYEQGVIPESVYLNKMNAIINEL